jgi:formylglycine-generating enzyme required for sulfatase activity
MSIVAGKKVHGLSPSVEEARREPPFGLNNMLGNVWEWVEDARAPFDSASQTDPVGRQ